MYSRASSSRSCRRGARLEGCSREHVHRRVVDHHQDVAHHRLDRRRGGCPATRGRPPGTGAAPRDVRRRPRPRAGRCLRKVGGRVTSGPNPTRRHRQGAAIYCARAHDESRCSEFVAVLEEGAEKPNERASWRVAGLSRRSVLWAGPGGAGTALAAPCAPSGGAERGGRRRGRVGRRRGGVRVLAAVAHRAADPRRADRLEAAGGALQREGRADDQRGLARRATPPSRRPLQTAFAGGSPPDGWQADQLVGARCGARRAFTAPLDDLMKRDRWDKNQVFTSAYETMTWSGKTWAMMQHPDVVFDWGSRSP